MYPPAPGLEERFQRSASQRNGSPGSPEKAGKAGVGVLVWGTGMLPRVKRAVPVAQTAPQPSPSGSRLPSAAGRWQLHLGLGGREAPSIPPDSRILTYLPRGKRHWWLPLSVEWSPVCGAPTRRRLPIPPCTPSPAPPPPRLSHAARQPWASTQALPTALGGEVRVRAEAGARGAVRTWPG